MRSSEFLLVLSSLTFGCFGSSAADAAPMSDRAEEVRFKEPAPELPHPSEKCPDGTLEHAGKCIGEAKAAEIVEEVSNEAVEKMIRVQDPGAQVHAQHELIQAQGARLEKAEVDLVEIKKKLKKAKAAGKGPFRKSPKMAKHPQHPKDPFGAPVGG